VSRRERNLVRLNATGVVVSCEHASNAIPRELNRLGLPRPALTSHIAWDPHARELAAILASRLGCPLIVGQFSRLVIDLNRSSTNRSLIPKTAFGTRVPGNRALTAADRKRRIRRYYEPYRMRVEGAVTESVQTVGHCVHISVHTFAPHLHGTIRRADVGLLYDPSRERERQLALSMRHTLAPVGLRVRMNYPYRGISDGFTSWLRRQLPTRQYVGLEIEVNQRILSDRWMQRRIAVAAAEVLREPI